MNAASSDRNLLLGIVALQMDFITRDALIEAMHVWTLEKHRPLSEILVDHAALDPADRAVLENLVTRHIARHGGDPARSLSALDLAEPVRCALGPLADADIQATLSHLGKASTPIPPGTDPDRTASYRGDGEETEGRFRILRLHDEGGLGSVFLAMDQELNREVALKQLKGQNAADAQSRVRFIREAEITGRLEHPGIVPVYGKGQYEDGRPYYAMRFVRGDHFKAAVDAFHRDPGLRGNSGSRRREFQKLLRRFLAVCETVAFAHDRGVIHRDLKPRNILAGPYGETLIVDWGLAKVIGHRDDVPSSEETLAPVSGSDLQPTLAGTRVGTPSYMSPEQARGEVDRLTPATDVYSLGATLYYLLTGQPPFLDRDPTEVLPKVQRGEFPSPREVRAGVDRSLNAIVLKAMALRPEDRYGSPRALADDLEHWLADQPISAYPEPLPTRAMRVVRRHKPLVAGAGLLLILGLVGLAWHAQRLARENERVRQARDQAANLLDLTRKTLRQQFVFAASRLAAFPKTERLREQLASEELEIYQKLRSVYPDDPEIRFETAEVYRILAAIRRVTGQLAGALAGYQGSIDLFAGLLHHAPRRNDAVRGLVQDLIDRGELYRMNGASRLARDDYRAALEHVEALGNEPDPWSYCNLKASALIDRSALLDILGQPAEAQADADEAIQLLEPLLVQLAPPRSDRIRWLLAIARTARGGATMERNPGVAEAALREALEDAGKITPESPFFNDAQCVQAVVFGQLGKLLLQDLARGEEALRSFDRAVSDLRRLAAHSPEIPYYREELAASIQGRGSAHLAQGHLAEAEKDCQEADTILTLLESTSPENPQYLSLLGQAKAQAARIHERSGRADEARRLILQARDLFVRVLRIDPDRHADRRSLDRIDAELKG